MFGELSKIAGVMKNAGKIKEKVTEVQASLVNLRLEGIAGDNQVMVVVNGHQQVVECKIDPSLLVPEQSAELEALILQATNEALEKAKKAVAEKMAAATEGLGLPDLQKAMSQFGLG